MDIRQPHLGGMSTLDLQTGLLGLGFDPGPRDGVYGPLTRDAVRKCQAAYGLLVDGVPGLEIRRLVSLRLPAFRVTARARAGQSLRGLASEIDTTVDAIIEGNRRKRYEDVFPGEQLVVHRRAVAALDGDEARGSRWTFVARPMGALAFTGVVESEAAATWDRAAGARADDRAGTRAARECFGIVSVPADGRRPWPAAETARWASRAGLRGIVLETADSGLDDDTIWAYLRTVKSASRACRQAGLRLAVTLPVRNRSSGQSSGQSSSQAGRVLGGYDLEDVGAAADIVLLDARDAYDPELFRNSIGWACKFVSRWKLMAVVELRPYHMGESGPEPVSRDDLIKLRARHVMREGRDGSLGLPYAAYRARGEVRRLWREDAASLGRKLHVVNRLNILGVAFRGADDAEEQVLAEIGRRFIIM